MRLFTLILMFVSIAASLTLYRTDGTTLELGNETMEVDLTDVIFPKPLIVNDRFQFVDSIDAVNTDNSPWYQLIFVENVDGSGRRGYTQGCAWPMGACRTDTVGVTPWISGVWVYECPAGTPNYGNGNTFYCFMWDTNNCDRSNVGLYVPWSLPDLTKLGWNVIVFDLSIATGTSGLMECVSYKQYLLSAMKYRTSGGFADGIDDEWSFMIRDDDRERWSSPTKA